MTIASWKSLYFPISAEAGSNDLKTAVSLDLLKYTGSDQQILRHYNLERPLNTTWLTNLDGIEDPQLMYHGGNCHLCSWAKKQCKILNPNPNPYHQNGLNLFCDYCPLPIKCGRAYNSDWYHFIETGDTTRLITTLSRILINNDIEDLVKIHTLSQPLQIE